MYALYSKGALDYLFWSDRKNMFLSIAVITSVKVLKCIELLIICFHEKRFSNFQELFNQSQQVLFVYLLLFFPKKLSCSWDPNN